MFGGKVAVGVMGLWVLMGDGGQDEGVFCRFNVSSWDDNG